MSAGADTPEGEVAMWREVHDDWMARVSALLMLLDDLGHAHHACNIVERVKSDAWHGKTDEEKRAIIADAHPDRAGIVIWGGGGDRAKEMALSPEQYAQLDRRRSPERSTNTPPTAAMGETPEREADDG